jgi:hypothetical protein
MPRASFQSQKDPGGCQEIVNFDGFVKSPSVPLEAGLRFNFVVAAHLVSALHSSVFARLASGAFYQTIFSETFCEIISFTRGRFSIAPNSQATLSVK